MANAIETSDKLELLHKPIQLDLRLNELRIIVGCFRAVAYMMKVDDEPYLDPDALELQEKLELAYQQILEETDEGAASSQGAV